MLEVDLRNYLLEQEEITSVIDTRIYPGWIPQEAVMPSMAFFKVTGGKHHDIDVAFPRVQFSVFSSRYMEAKQLANSVVKAISRYKGVMGETKILQIVFQNEYDLFESDRKLYHVAVEFKIIYRE